MRLGVFSDVHGNLFALHAILDELTRMGVDTLVYAARHVLKPGSVNQSRQREIRPRTRSLVVELDARVVDLGAVSYDVAACADALARVGFSRASLHSRPGVRAAYLRARRMVLTTTGIGRRGGRAGPAG